MNNYDHLFEKAKEEKIEKHVVGAVIINGQGMFYINATENLQVEYPKYNQDLKQGIYENKFKCKDGYTLINYLCISIKKIASSGIFFG